MSPVKMGTKHNHAGSEVKSNWQYLKVLTKYKECLCCKFMFFTCGRLIYY